MTFSGAGSSLSRDALLLPPRQAEILAFVRAYTALAREPVSASLVARRFGRDVKTIRDHFATLHRKGWLRSRTSPASPRDDDPYRGAR